MSAMLSAAAASGQKHYRRTAALPDHPLSTLYAPHLLLQGEEVDPLSPPPQSITAPPEFTIFPCSEGEKERRKSHYQLVARTAFFSPFFP